MISDALKKVFYTGIGIAAVTVEKTGEIIDSLEQKGVQAVKDGKIEDLKRKMASVESNVKDVLDSLEKMSKEQIELIKEKLTAVDVVIDQAEDDVKVNAEAVLSSLEKMSKEEIESVKSKIEQISQNWSNQNDQEADQ